MFKICFSCILFYSHIDARDNPLLYLILPPWSTLEQKLGRSLHGFLSMKRLEIFLLPPGWDASLTQSCPSIKFAGTHFYNWVERGTVRVLPKNTIYYMASSLSGQDQSNSLLWSEKKFPRKPYNKSFTDQACSFKMARYCPRSVSIHEHEKRISSHLELTLGQ